MATQTSANKVKAKRGLKPQPNVNAKGIDTAAKIQKMYGIEPAACQGLIPQPTNMN
jgi:hypothetical protein